MQAIRCKHLTGRPFEYQHRLVTRPQQDLIGEIDLGSESGLLWMKKFFDLVISKMQLRRVLA
ncbi:hypothetical protein A6R71_18545 [Xanthomonas translucens pv. arrhenatheri]|nr:hypothetical protein A6R71_18545 [Xanthomonas translucens pv. arrhenatheri]